MRRYAIVVGGIAMSIMTAALQVTSAAAETQITAVICGSTQANLTKVQPIANEVTTTTVPYTISGSLRQLQSIRVFIDDLHRETILVGPLDSTFSYAATVPFGVHSVRLQGVDICGQSSPTVTVQITYSSAEGASVTGDAITTAKTQGPLIPAATTHSNAVDTHNLSNQDGIAGQSGGLSGEDVVSRFRPGLIYVGIVASPSDTVTLRTVVRVVTVLIGLVALFFAPLVVRRIGIMMRRTAVWVPVFIKRYARWIVRFGGAGLLAAAVLFI